MPQIRIRGLAAVFQNDVRIVDANVLASLVPLTYDEEVFTDYLGGTEIEDALLLALERGGVLQFDHEALSDLLTVTVEFQAKRTLSQQELDALIDYTMGQWSDGIGENWTSESADRTGYAIQCLIPEDESFPPPYPIVEISDR